MIGTGLPEWEGGKEKQTGYEIIQMKCDAASRRDSLLSCYTRVHRVACGNASFGRLGGGGAAGGRGGGSGAVGWGHLRIPECMTRCSRSDRSQPRLMKPKHFHRCFCTPGSASAVWQLRPHSLFSAVRSGALSPAPADARLMRRERTCVCERPRVNIANGPSGLSPSCRCSQRQRQRRSWRKSPLYT